MSTGTIRGLASIIIPCCNQLEFTKQCIRALVPHTRQPWELIVVDNGSTDDTASYLAGVQDGAAVPVTVVANATNRGFPAAINQGLQVAHGEYLVLLNNDVVVTDGWLDQLVGLANVKTCRRNAETPKGLKEEWEQRGNITVIDFEEDAGKGGGCASTGGGLSQPLASDLEGGEGLVAEASAATPPDHAFEDAVSGSAGIIPPGPPFTRGGNCAQSADVGSIKADRVAAIGLVGPMSNYAIPPQLVENVPYRDIADMHSFARRWRDEHRGTWFTVPKLSGFCLLMKRVVYDKIGGLDERFGIGFFDDDDLAERARRAGFELAVARDLFVHHFGSRTFAGNGIDAEKLFDENAKRFAAKWGLPGTNGRRVALQPWKGPGELAAAAITHRGLRTEEISRKGAKPAKDEKPFESRSSGDLRAALQRSEPASDLVASELFPSSSLAPLRLCASSHSDDKASSTDLGERPRVTLTMIVRDEEKNLPACLESVRGVFDEIVVVDTGSTDRTIEIARSFGAKVFDLVWIDDFAAARNEALALATGDYAFWLDADDVVEPPERAKLEALLRGLRAGDAAAYVVRCACDPSPDGTGGETVVDHMRLFPIREGVRWTYRVHEQILPALKRAGFPVVWTDLTVRHTGYVDKALRSRKLDRDTKILMRELDERPDEPFVLFNLGAIAVEREAWHQALGYLKRSLAGSAPTDSIVRKLYALIARVHQMTGESHEALRTCADGLRLDPEDAELWFRKGVVHRHRGESSEADRSWRRILTLKRPDRFCSFDQGIYGHLTRRNLAMLAAERGGHAEAENLWREVLAECPGDREALAKLARLRPVPI